MNTIENRRAARAACNASGSCPVRIVLGDRAPRLVGESYHWETAGGTRINHPAAYSKKGWSNCFYIASTLRVIVGIGWLVSEQSDVTTDERQDG